MSEIRATTISDAAGTGPITLTKQSAAKAWCNYHHSGGTPTISGSFNVSSLDDSGVGMVGVNVTNSFNSVGDCCPTASGWGYVSWLDSDTATRVTSASQAVVSKQENGSGRDAGAGITYPMSVTIHGDLA